MDFSEGAGHSVSQRVFAERGVAQKHQKEEDPTGLFFEYRGFRVVKISIIHALKLRFLYRVIMGASL
ncbi:MAG: hypothetical protein AAGB06_03205 [Verrucomicrobiota bacterium]